MRKWPFSVPNLDTMDSSHVQEANWRKVFFHLRFFPWFVSALCASKTTVADVLKETILITQMKVNSQSGRWMSRCTRATTHTYYSSNNSWQDFSRNVLPACLQRFCCHGNCKEVNNNDIVWEWAIQKVFLVCVVTKRDNPPPWGCERPWTCMQAWIAPFASTLFCSGFRGCKTPANFWEQKSATLWPTGVSCRSHNRIHF